MTALDVDDAKDRLVDVYLRMRPDQKERWLATFPPETVRYVENAVRRYTDPEATDAYRRIGYEPICIPRVRAALAAGYENPIAAEADRFPLPAMCGQCPAERYDTATEFDVLYGGAAGGSKTLSTIMFTIRCMVRYPGFRALLLRETYDELDENVFPELRKIDYAEAVGGRWNAGRRELTIGESAFRFRYLQKIEDIGRRRGGSYQLICFDERNMMAPGVADGLRDRLRSANVKIPVIGFRSTANPGGRGHGECKRQYITATDHGAFVARIRTGRGEFDRRFIPAKASDNPYLGDDYFENVLGGIEDPVLRAAMADGDWDKFSGQFFDEWDRDRHVVPRDSVRIGEHSWPRLEGVDYGRAAPFCMLRAAQDGDGRLWLYREIYQAGLGEKAQAKLILEDEEACGDRDAVRWADPAMWNRTQDAPAVADTYKTVGVPLRKANNDRKTGWARVHSFLEDGEPCHVHAALGWESCPMLHVLEGTCPNLVRTLPDMPFSRTIVEDLDTDAEDHAVDSLRYLAIHARPPEIRRRRRRLYGGVVRDAVYTTGVG